MFADSSSGRVAAVRTYRRQAARPQAQPLFQQRGIDSAEIERMLRILAIELLCWVRTGTRVAARRNSRADDKGAATRAVIRATAVIPDAPSELGEHQDDDLIGSIVLFQVA